ncbi:unnamed protein product [Discosporangium mesarthrocarpum]
MAREHPMLKTPSGFRSLPLPSALADNRGGGRRLWAWVPTPRSAGWVALGLVFTDGPEPPPLTAVRCVRRELVKDAEPKGQWVVTLAATSKKTPMGICEPPLELVLVKETGLAIPRDGAAWGLTPCVLVGEADNMPPGPGGAGSAGGNRGDRGKGGPGPMKRGWDGLMPAVSCTSEQSMVINIGGEPFRHLPWGYRPLTEVVQSRARFVLQVYNVGEGMWEDIRSSHKILDNQVQDRQDLVGRWRLDAGEGAVMENDVFACAGQAQPGHAEGDSRDDGKAIVRLPPGRASEGCSWVPGALMPLEGLGDVWGFSMLVVPRFPHEVGPRVHPLLRQRFEVFKSWVWGGEGEAWAIDTRLIRYVNSVVRKRALSTDALLSSKWDDLKPVGVDLLAWPTLAQAEAGTFSGDPGSLAAGAGETVPHVHSCASNSGFEEKNDGGGWGAEEVGSASGTTGGFDPKWVWITAKQECGQEGVPFFERPLLGAEDCWRITPGHVVLGGPWMTPGVGDPASSDEAGTGSNVAGGETETITEAGRVGWRNVCCMGGQIGFVAVDTLRLGPSQDLEIHRANIKLFSGFSGLAQLSAGEGCPSSSTSSLEGFWLPLRGQASDLGGGLMLDTIAIPPSPFSALELKGNSTAIVKSAADMRTAGETLIMGGKWTVGPVTDMMTVVTRTSGYTRYYPDAVPSVSRGGRGSEESVVPPPPHQPPPIQQQQQQQEHQDQQQHRSELKPQPMLVDGLLFGFRPVDGMLLIGRVYSRAASKGEVEPLNPGAMAVLGPVEQGSEVSFTVVDSGEEVVFSCREMGGARRAAMVRARCGDDWGCGRVALGLLPSAQSPNHGWLRVVSQMHGATVRTGVSIDLDEVVGRIPCGTVVMFDETAVYTTPRLQGGVDTDPVRRYRCRSTSTTPGGWISERGRHANHPYRICNPIIPEPGCPPALVSHLTIGSFGAAAAATGQEVWDGSLSLRPPPGTTVLPQPCQSRGRGKESGRVGGHGGGGISGGEPEWRNMSRLAGRFHLLQELNRVVALALPYVDLAQAEEDSSVAWLFARSRHVIFSALKEDLWEAGLARTACPLHRAQCPDLLLNRGRAAHHALSGRPDTEGRHTLFGQAFWALRGLPATTFCLRQGEALYSTVFVGEHAHDAGGPYRESFAQYCAELQSGALSLLIRCPNAVNDVGINREKWVPSPRGATETLQLEMLSFLGRLMGVAIRTHQFLDLNLPSIIWKQLVCSKITRKDLEAIDCVLTQTLAAIQDVDQQGVTAKNFADLGLGGFTVTTIDGSEAELLPGGADIAITFNNRHEYIALVEQFKKGEFAKQVEAIRSGLGTVVPLQLLSLFSWYELEEFVCGTPDVDVDLLWSCTDYSGCSRTDSHVEDFWHVLRSFSTQEKALFLRFTWGRSRLPLSANQFRQRFKIQAFLRTPPDAYLPVAHTCFFSLELPHYSSRQLMEAKLRYAIHNCQAIDADDTSVGRNTAGMGWDEGPPVT